MLIECLHITIRVYALVIGIKTVQRFEGFTFNVNTV